MRAFAHAVIVLVLLLMVQNVAPAPALAAGPVEPRGASARVPEVDFRDTPLDQAIAKLQAVTGQNIVVHWRVLEGAGITRATPVNLAVARVPLGSAIKLLGDAVAGGDASLGLAAREDRGVVVVSTTEELDNLGVVRLYDVRDLLEADMARRAAAPPPPPHAATTHPATTHPATTHPAAQSTTAATSENATQTMRPDQVTPFMESIDRLTHVIYETVDPQSWRVAGGTVGAIHEFNGRLVVTQTPAAHERIAALLDGLRRNGATHAKRD
jgi:hypothetical protein